MKEEEIARKYKECLDKLGEGKMPTEGRMIYSMELGEFSEKYIVPIYRKIAENFRKNSDDKTDDEDEEEEVLGEDGDLVGIRELEEKEMGGGNCYYELSELRIERER